MDEGGDSAVRILQALRFHPRGMTITEIAKKTHITRNSVSKHLELLRIAGQVDMRVIGNAKLYSLAQRVPLSAFLCFTNNLIVVLDNHGNIVQINDMFLNFAGVRKDEIIGKNLRQTSLPVISTEETMAIIEGVEQEQFITDVRYEHNNMDFFYNMQVIPTVFEDGERGRTIVLEDITEKKKYLRTMEFLAKTAMNFVDLPGNTDIYKYIAERLIELIPRGQVVVQSYDQDRNQLIVRSVMDHDFHDSLTSMIGREPVGIGFTLDENISSILCIKSGETPRGIREINFASGSGEDAISLYDLAGIQIPEKICKEIEKSRNIGKVYIKFFAWKKSLLGSVIIFMAPDDVLEETRALESFIRQASIAISKRITEERLHKSNARLRQVVDLAPFAAAIICSDGRYTFINHKFTEIFGYTLADIPDGIAWFQKVYPDPGLRKKAVSAWKSDLEQADVNQVRPRTFQVRCKNGEMKTILFKPVTLSDRTQYIVYEDVTELRRMHQILLSDIAELVEAKENLLFKEGALALLKGAVAIAGVEGHLKYANPAFISRWGYESIEEVMGRHVSEFLAGSPVLKNLIPLPGDIGQWSGRVSGIRKDMSTFSVQASISRLTDNNDKIIGYVGSFNEIGLPL